MVRDVYMSKMAKSQLKTIKAMQGRLDEIYKLSNPNVTAMMGVIEKLEPMIGSVSIFNENVRPILERQMEIKNAITASLPVEVLREVSIRQEKLKYLTNGSVIALGKQLEIIRENQDLFAEAAVAASSMYARLNDIEKQHFEELDKLQSEEDVKKLEEIVGTDVIRNKAPLSFFICMFFMILSLISFGGARELEDNQDGSIDKNPLYTFATNVGVGVLSSWVYDNLCKGLTKVSCYIKNGFCKKSKKVLKIDVNQEIYIVGEERYYYKTIYHNEKGELKEGYVAKRNVKIIQNLKE